MKSRVFKILLLLCSVFSAFSAKAEIYTTPDGHQVEISLVPDKTEILVNEPLYFSLEIKNLSGEDIGFVDGGDYRNEFGRPDSFTVEAREANGAEVRKIVSKMNFGGLVGARKIPAGGKQTVRFLTSHWLDFEKAGRFTISCQKNMVIRKYVEAPQSDMFRADSVPVKVKTDVIVKPRNDTALGKVIDYFGNNIFAPDDTKKNEAVKALIFIDDKRVIKYFVKTAEKISAGDRDYSDFKYYVFRALAKFNDELAFNTIIKNINSADDEMRRNISIALSDCKYPKAEEYLLSMRTDKYDAVRLDVVHYLGKTKTPKSTELLKTMINDSSKLVRDEGRRYLRERGATDMIN